MMLSGMAVDVQTGWRTNTRGIPPAQWNDLCSKPMQLLILSRKRPSYSIPGEISGLVQQADSAYSQGNEMLKHSQESITLVSAVE